jgi:Flp pilus assembly protein TadG
MCVRSGRRGAALVEVALVLVPLLALFFAVMDFAFVIFLRSTFQHAVREGVRYAITQRTDSGMGQDASIKARVQANALGFLNGQAGASKIFIRYYVPGTLQVTQSNAGGNICEVSVEGYTWGWMAPLLRSNLPLMTIQARSSDRMEPPPGGTPPAR